VFTKQTNEINWSCNWIWHQKYMLWKPTSESETWDEVWNVWRVHSFLILVMFSFFITFQIKDGNVFHLKSNNTLNERLIIELDFHPLWTHFSFPLLKLYLLLAVELNRIKKVCLQTIHKFETHVTKIIGNLRWGVKNFKKV
jgi:hypothetical protein